MSPAATVRLGRRPEAVYACVVELAHLDDGLLEAVAALDEAGVHVALAGFGDAAQAVAHFDRCRLGRVVVADGDRALAPRAGQRPRTLWERRSGVRFSDWLFDHLWRRGVGPMLVAVAAPAADGAAAVPAGVVGRVMQVPLEAGPGLELTSFLHQILQDRTDGALAGVDESAGWVVAVEASGDGDPEAVQASLLALSSGTIGVRGDLEDRVGVDHFVLAAGGYGRGGDGLVRPLPGPAVTMLDETDHNPVVCRRVLDLRTGVLVRQPNGDGLATVRFVSITRPGVVAMRGEDSRIDAPWPAALEAPTVTSGRAAEHSWMDRDRSGTARAVTTSDRAAISAAAVQRCWQLPDRRRVERIATFRAAGIPCGDDDGALLALARSDGFDRLLEEHRHAWACRWDAADIEITGDPDSQLAVRYALFHLLSCARTEGEAAVGARGLTGLAYAGHVFWDTDVHVLPALAATLPDAARAVLAYRANRLPAARHSAAARGLPGARFPWESADDGRDVTPTSTRDIEGNVVPIRTGEHAEHINADVAWAVRHYLDWTGDDELREGDGRALVVETARYWHARVRLDAAGRGHLYGVVGPDEYHEVVDDNAYTNIMARWHLRWAAVLARDHGADAEAARFEKTARTLVDGFDPGTGRHEQFAGFWELEPLLISDLVEPPVAADVLLGRDRVRRVQVIKQPDVLMAHHLLPGECPPGSLAADLAYYLPRTAHGSSLSPAICAALVARAGRPDDAMALFDLAARLDLDDLTGTTAGGLHLATMGGLWQAVVYGFAGIRPTGDRLGIDPRLPLRWERLSIRVHFRGHPVRVVIDHDHIDVQATVPVPVTIEGRALRAPVHVERRPDPRRNP